MTDRALRSLSSAHLPRRRFTRSVARRTRLDAELVRLGLARSRHHASDLIAQGRVRVRGAPATKAATGVSPDEPLIVVPAVDGRDYVSRGGFKLAGALASFAPAGLHVEGVSALDAGASTGGFTQVLLDAGVAAVTAVDVGYGQLAESLRQDPRVFVLDRTNVRTLRREDLPYVPDLVVADLSFISLTKVLPAFVSVASESADLVVMVKPQFEVGKDKLGKGGVVRDPTHRVQSVLTVAASASDLGLGVQGVCPSVLPGPSGNVEYFVWMRRGAPVIDPSYVMRVVSEGPQ